MRNIIGYEYGHTSPETAYVFEDWPYGRSLRCKRRVWLEFKPKHGFRFVSQTTNPKAGNSWNKPHASTYAECAVMVWVESEESPTGKELSWVGLHTHDDDEKIAKFEAAYPDAIKNDENLRKQISGLKLLNRIYKARQKLETMFSETVKLLEGDFNREALLKIFAEDEPFGLAIEREWLSLKSGVPSIKDWVRGQFQTFMDAYHAGWEKAKAIKPEGYKLLAPRAYTVEAGDLYHPPFSDEFAPGWVPATRIGFTVDSRGYYCRLK